MRTISINIPDSMTLESHELQMILTIGLFKDGRISLGQAAELNGLSENTLIELLNQRGVSIFTDEVGELQTDIANA